MTEAFIGSKWLYIILVIYASTWTLSESIPNRNAAKIREVFRWKHIEFDYPSESARQEAIDNGDFIPGRSLLIDVDVYYGSRGQKVFIGMPRMQGGHPATIATVTNKTTADGNPIVKPYPSWDWHKNLNDCPTNRIVSVFRVKVDECGRLWILDTGSRNDSYICPAQILAFDLKTDTLLYRYEIPSNQYEPRSVFVVPVVDVRDKQCKDTIVYVSDCQGFAIIVYNPSLGVSWKVGDKTMYPYPSSGTYEIQGTSFELMDGILGMAISPYKPGKDRILYYRALSSTTENFVSTSYLRNRTRFENNPQSSPEIFHTYKGTRPSQSAAEAIDKDGISYFGLAHETTLNCWNTATEYGPQNIDTLSYNPTTLQFISGIKVINNPLGFQELWFVSDRFQKFYTSTLSLNETNFRIHTVRVDDVLRGSKCKSSRFQGIEG